MSDEETPPKGASSAGPPQSQEEVPPMAPVMEKTPLVGAPSPEGIQPEQMPDPEIPPPEAVCTEQTPLVGGPAPGMVQPEQMPDPEMPPPEASPTEQTPLVGEPAPELIQPERMPHPEIPPSEAAPTEQTPLVGGPAPGMVQGECTVQLKGVPPQLPSYGGLKSTSGSTHEMTNLVESQNLLGDRNSISMSTSRASSVTADGAVPHLTPLQMGRHELYEDIPFTADFGLQEKERSMSEAVSSNAADLDMLEADQISMAMNQKHLMQKERQMRHSQASLILRDELKLDKDMVTTPLIFAVFVATMSQFLVGYNIGVMNAPESVVFPGHSTAEWSVAVAAFCFGAPFGAYYAGNLAESRGRRGALLISTWTFLIGGMIQTTAINMLFIIVSRLIIGLASGICTVIVPIYLGELAPPTIRGTLGTLTQFSIVVGILMSDIFAFPLATEDKWRGLFSITMIMSFFQLMCAPFLLETPRWLLSKKPDCRNARYIIKRLRGLQYDEEIDVEVNRIVGALKAQNLDGGNETKTLGFRDMIEDKKVRLLVVSSFVLQALQQLSGINAVFYYSTSFFEGVIDNPMVGTCVVAGVNVISTYIALLLMDSFGRRTLILWSSAGMFFSCIVIVMSLKSYFSNVIALVAVNVYVFFFEIGLGPIPWLIVAEMFDAKYVATAMSACSQLNWIFNFTVGLTFPYLVKYLQEDSFVPFAVVLLCGFIFAYIWLPETQGTTPEEMQAAL